MKSVNWPINWSYEGDLVKAKEFHGEGRAVLGQLKNNTYGGANLGQNRLVKKYHDGVEITAEILPGIDKVHIFVPIPEEEKKKEEEEYHPYLWVGVRIISGGGYLGETSEHDEGLTGPNWQRVTLNIWEPPQDDKLGDGWTPLDPNETEMLSSLRTLENGVAFLCYNADCWPLQFYRYWLPDEEKCLDSFGNQKYIMRSKRIDIGTYLYGNGPGIFRSDVCLQYTNDGLMMVEDLNPYDPEFDFDNPDDDKVWFETAWCDPITPVPDFNERTPPRKWAGGTTPGYEMGYIRPGSGGAETYDNWYGYEQLYEKPEIKAKIIPGQYIVKVGIQGLPPCPPVDLPIIVEIEGRVGNPKFGRQTKKRIQVAIGGDPSICTYVHNYAPYGLWGECHTITGEDVCGTGRIAIKGKGPDPHSPDAWWQGAMLLDAFNGVIKVEDYVDLSGKEYNWRSSNWAGTYYGNPFEAGIITRYGCETIPCADGVPCAHTDKTVWGAFAAQGVKPVDIRAGAALPWIEYVIFDESTAFIISDYKLHYLTGKKGFIECTWQGAEYIPDNPYAYFATDLFLNYVVICDDKYTDYNGEYHPAYVVGQFDSSDQYLGPVELGEEIIIFEAYLTKLWIAPIDNVPNIILLRKACADFEDAAGGPPPGY